MTKYKVVPVEPSEAMLKAPLGPSKPQFENRLDLRPTIYRAMLKHAPESGMVAVPRELLLDIKHGCSWGEMPSERTLDDWLDRIKTVLTENGEGV